MASEIIMMGQYLGYDCGLSAYVLGIDSRIEYNKISIYLEEYAENVIDVEIDEYVPHKTTCATFDGLELDRYYNVIAHITYRNGNTNTINNRIFASETLMYEPMLMSSSESGAGGNPDGAVIEKPSTYTPLNKADNPAIQPIFTTVKYQYGESCVACSLSTAMSIYSEKNARFIEDYSVSYIFGSDNRPNENYMYFGEAIDNCIRYGSPRWELASGIRNDGLSPEDASKANACERFSEWSNNSIIYNNALKQRFSRKQECNFYHSKQVYAAILSYGYFMFNFKIPSNFSDYDAQGRILPPSSASTLSENAGFGASNKPSGANHSIALIGLVYFDDDPYWIAQNSWGTGWGVGGYCYIPCDWGYDSEGCWALESYAVEPGDEYETYVHPAAPTSLSATIDSSRTEIQLAWNASTTSGSSYIVLYSNGNRWNVVWGSYTGGTIVNIPKTDDMTTNTRFMVLAMNDYCCSRHSDYAYLGILNPKITMMSQHPSYVSVEEINVDRSDVEYTSVLYIKKEESSEWIKCRGDTWFFSDHSPIYGNEYQFKIVITYLNDNNSVFEESNIISLTLNELPNIQLESAMVKRIHKGFILGWTSPYVGKWKENEYYDIRLYNGDSYSYLLLSGDDNESGYSSIFMVTINDEDLINANDGSLDHFDYATTYQLDIRYFCRPTTIISGCEFVRDCYSSTKFNITTAPAEPVITSATESDGIITVNWTLQDVNSNISQVYINVHDPDSVLVLNTTETSTSGSFTYSAVKDGQHKITMSSCYVVGDNQPIFAVDNNGDTYYAIAYVTVGAPQIEYWSWPEEILKERTIEVVGNHIPVVSSKDWNEFTAKINEVRNVLGYSDYSFTKAAPGVNFKDAHNEAIDAMKGAGGTSYLYYIYPGDTFKSAIFGSLQNAINILIDTI